MQTTPCLLVLFALLTGCSGQNDKTGQVLKRRQTSLSRSWDHLSLTTRRISGPWT